MGHKNYNKMSNKPETVKQPEPKETIEVETTEAVEAIEPETKEYIVTNCEKLNVRANPSLAAKVLGTVTADAILVGFPENSNEKWISVVTESGLDGFCMKQYLTEKK